MAREDNSLSGRVRRYAQVSTNMGGVAARLAGDRLLGLEGDRGRNAAELRRALGTLRGPIMKVAQILATIPDAVPEEYALELAQLQSNAPPMGWLFVKRRMAAELGPDWRRRFRSFSQEAAAAASLGQVHRAVHPDGRLLACKLQYPDMRSAVEADLRQLGLIFALYRRMDRTLDTSRMQEEIAARLREELDYRLEAGHMRLYAAILAEEADIHVPEVVAELSTERLLTMTWLEGRPLLSFRDAPIEARNMIAANMFRAWWLPFARYGVIHGDPHLGNYTIRPDCGVNLLDYGCIRTFRPDFVQGVIDLYHALRDGDRALAVHAYETWGFRHLSQTLIDTLNIWAQFIYGPLLDDRTRTLADGVRPAEYGRAQAATVHARLRELGPITPPREFVFMDRAAIGLGAVFLHLGAERNWHLMFEETIADFERNALAERQARTLKKAGVPLPT